MAHTAPLPLPQRTDLIERLERVVSGRGLLSLGHRLAELHRWVQDDMASFETELDVLPRGAAVVQRCAHHLLDLDGKHLRPMCVVLAAKLGTGFDDAARHLAMAVELVHTATLLHDDVIDQGDVRRGKPAPRALYGNAASIYAGDWLLIKALQRIRMADSGPLLDGMLQIIDEMVLAESVQLENRGRINTDLGDYFRVVEGKTAALFRWAMRAGATVSGLRADQIAALEDFGLHLGVAFQAVDDLLDLDGDAQRTGKALFTDLREGKMTYPMILALERKPDLMGPVERCAAVLEGELPAQDIDALLVGLDSTGALADCRALAQDRSERAIASLSIIEPGPARDALVTIAHATAIRES